MKRDRGLTATGYLVIFSAITIGLTTLVLALLAFGYLDISSLAPPSARAGYSVSYQSDSVLRVSLTEMQLADEVYVVSSFGSQYSLTSIGAAQQLLNVQGDQQVKVIGEYKGRETQIGAAQLQNPIQPDIVVRQNSSESPSTIAEAIDQAEPGDTIILTKGIYEVGHVEVDKSVQIVAEYGTTIRDTTLDDSQDSTITVSADGVVLSNVEIDANGEMHGVHVHGEQAQLRNVHFTGKESTAVSSETEVVVMPSTDNLIVR